MLPLRIYHSSLITISDDVVNDENLSARNVNKNTRLSLFPSFLQLKSPTTDGHNSTCCASLHHTSHTAPTNSVVAYSITISGFTITARQMFLYGAVPPWCQSSTADELHWHVSEARLCGMHDNLYRFNHVSTSKTILEYYTFTTSKMTLDHYSSRPSVVTSNITSNQQRQSYVSLRTQPTPPPSLFVSISTVYWSFYPQLRRSITASPSITCDRSAFTQSFQ